MHKSFPKKSAVLSYERCLEVHSTRSMNFAVVKCKKKKENVESTYQSANIQNSVGKDINVNTLYDLKHLIVKFPG